LKLPALPPLPSRDDRTLLPALLAALLVLMMAIQFALPVAEELPSDARRVVPSGSVEAVVGRVVADPVIVRNALFSPSRGSAASAAAGVGNGPLGGATVVGMVRVGKVARAIIQQADGMAVSVAVGGVYRGWTLVALSTTRARFLRDGERLAMDFTNGAILPNTNTPRSRPEEE